MDVYFSVIVFVRYIEQGRARPLSIRNKSTFIDASVGVSYIRCNMDIIMGHIPHRIFFEIEFPVHMFMLFCFISGIVSFFLFLNIFVV